MTKIEYIISSSRFDINKSIIKIVNNYFNKKYFENNSYVYRICN